MSGDPTFNQVVTSYQGDLGCGRGMLGIMAGTVAASSGPIEHTPGTFYSNYYTHYIVDIDAIGDFNLAIIGPTGVSVGYTMCIESLFNITSDYLGINANAVQIGKIYRASKAFLTAISAPNVWKLTYAVPEGIDNRLLVYNGTSPEVQTLPIKKELDYNGNYEYGIKSIESYDASEPSNLIDLVNYTNPNKIVIEGSKDSNAALASLVSDAIHATIACDTTQYNPTGDSISAMIACYDSSNVNQVGNGKALIEIATRACTLDSSAGIGVLQQCAIAGSQTCTISTAGVPDNNIVNAAIIASGFSSIGLTDGGANDVAVIACDSCDNNSSTCSVVEGSINSFVKQSVQCAIAGSESSDITTSEATSIASSSGIHFTNSLASYSSGSIGVTAAGNLISLSGANSGTVDSANNVGVYQCTNFGVSSEVITAYIASDGLSASGNDRSGCISSIQTNFANNYLSEVIAGGQSEITGTTATGVIASSACVIVGDESESYAPLNGYENIAAGVTVLSSHNIKPDFTSNDYRYMVIGGFNVPTWSIDSKTGNHYGASFVPGQALPGFAEMFPNLVREIIPYARLLQIENGAVRLSRDGETGFMVSRPFSTAAFVGGNPTFAWPGIFLTDPAGELIKRDYTAKELKDLLSKMGKEINGIKLDETSDKLYNYNVINPEWDPSKPYIPRSQRREEWSCCEKSGIVLVELDDYPVDHLADHVGRYLISGKDGKGKLANRITNIKILEIVGGFAKVDIANQHIPEMLEFDSIITDGKIVMPEFSIKDLKTAGSFLELTSPTRLSIWIKFLSSDGDYDNKSVVLMGDKEIDFSLRYVRQKNHYFIAELDELIEAGKYEICITAINASVKIIIG